MITSQLPSEAELERLSQALDGFTEHYQAAPEARNHITKQIAPANASPEERTELAAWTLLVHSLLNLDIAKTRQ